MRTSREGLQLQRKMVEERSRGQRRKHLLEVPSEPGDGSSFVWNLACEEELLRLQQAAGFAGRALRCGRMVWEHFASPSEVSELRAFAEESFQELHHRGAEVSLVLPSQCDPGTSAGPMGIETSALLDRVRAAVSGVAKADLHLRAALLRRVQLPAITGPRQLMPEHDSFAAHADRATVAAYHYSAVLYLSGADEFQDGELAFMDSDAEVVLAAAKGRLLAFSSGLENLHRVVPPIGGPRYVLAMWFGL
ncbi:unnamed protein product [Effrenium voratum]|uniref:Prolyl 4-hydroxylase alpha subunit domain-containing protein n=1 Tax=Effrenium voratum TaxID=2562239 RepID=A0AA36I1V5_9DINO|nr:unnamed protein product [Effrenium voratum]